MANRTQQAATGGFTLIEVLTVLAIIGLLLGLTAVAVGRYTESGRITEARAQVTSLAMLIDSYADRMGEPPPSRLAALGITDANAVNEGIEALVVAFKHPDYMGKRPDESWQANRDDDSTQMLRLVDGSRALLEINDPWDNPLMYFVHGDYEHEMVYRLEDEEGVQDETVRAARNPLTDTWHRFDSYQLLSAGPDGQRDTEDDIANYEIPVEEY